MLLLPPEKGTSLTTNQSFRNRSSKAFAAHYLWSVIREVETERGGVPSMFHCQIQIYAQGLVGWHFVFSKLQPYCRLQACTTSTLPVRTLPTLGSVASHQPLSKPIESKTSTVVVQNSHSGPIHLLCAGLPVGKSRNPRKSRGVRGHAPLPPACNSRPFGHYFTANFHFFMCNIQIYKL